MGVIKDDERRLRAAMAKSPGAPASAMAKRIGIKDSRSRYLRRKIGDSERWTKPLAAVVATQRQLKTDLAELPESQIETPEEKETDGDLPRQEQPGLDDSTGCPDNPPSS